MLNTLTSYMWSFIKMLFNLVSLLVALMGLTLTPCGKHVPSPIDNPLLITTYKCLALKFLVLTHHSNNVLYEIRFKVEAPPTTSLVVYKIPLFF